MNLRDLIALEQAQARAGSTTIPLPFRCPTCGFRSPVQIHGHRNPISDRFDPYCTEPLTEVLA